MKRLPPLNALRAFDAAVRSGSFTRAGERLNVTQGAVSRQVKQLEDWLGRPVFLRQSQGLVLTPAGGVLARSIESAFGHLTQAVEQIQQLGARQRLSVNVPETFASRWLAPRLRGFHGRHPDIDLSITTNAVTNRREARQYDCLVMYLSEPWRDGDCRLLRQEQHIAVASPELWQDGLPPDLTQATLLHILAGERRLPVWENWLAAQGNRRVDPRPGIAFSTMDQAINAAVAGAGVAVVDAPMVERDLLEQRLRRLDGHELIGPQGYWFVEARDSGDRDPAHLAAVSLFQDWLLAASR
ncbi:MAG: LysR family transcriptional regulator [Rhodoferax sp.]|nr:LysR family transcriptional regulator [Rhodoferax sp.]